MPTNILPLSEISTVNVVIDVEEQEYDLLKEDIVASSIFILRGISGWKVAEGLFLVLGIVLGIVVCTLSPTRTPDALWFVFIAGAIAICAMILPGVSGSFILLILGKYKFIMAAITAFVSNAGDLWG